MTDEETAALGRVLRDTIDADRYPLSPRVQRLKGILNKLRAAAGPRAASAPEAIRASKQRQI